MLVIRPRPRVWLGLFVGLLTMPIPLRAAPPSVTYLFPAGAARGQSVKVTVGGSFERWPVRVWVNEPGLRIEPGQDKGTLTVVVDADAVPGARWVRLYDEQGASALKPFLISPLPAVREVEANDAPSQAQRLDELPVVVDGRLNKRGDVDGVAVPLQAGQTLVAVVEAQRLGSPMDAVLQLARTDGLVLAQAEDAIGLDPLLVYMAPRDDLYVVRTFAFPATPTSSISFAGGDDFVYRLTLTTGPYLDHVRPLAVGADSPLTVEAIGWNLGDDLKRLPIGPIRENGTARVWHPALGQVVELPARSDPSLVEEEAAEVQDVSIPASITGRIDRGEDVDVYRFSSSKGRAWRFQVAARRLGSPLDPLIRVTDDTGKPLAEQDDTGNQRDPELTVTTPGDGWYRVEIRDLTGQGGLRHVYRLEAVPRRPDFALSLADDRITVARGKTTEIKVTVLRQDDFDQPIEVRLNGLPEGVSAEPAMSQPKGSSAKQVSLTVKAADAATPFQGPIALVGVGRSDRDHVRLERSAAFTIAGTEETTAGIWLTVTP